MKVDPNDILDECVNWFDGRTRCRRVSQQYGFVPGEFLKATQSGNFTAIANFSSPQNDATIVINIPLIVIVFYIDILSINFNCSCPSNKVNMSSVLLLTISPLDATKKWLNMAMFFNRKSILPKR